MGSYSNLCGTSQSDPASLEHIRACNAEVAGEAGANAETNFPPPSTCENVSVTLPNINNSLNSSACLRSNAVGKSESPVPIAMKAAVPQSNLAARRNFPSKLQVAPKEEPVNRKKITACSNFSEVYETLREVMPSCHSGMQVIHARHKALAMDVVVKVRIKKLSFRNNEEAEWRTNTEFMLNMPTSNHICQMHEVLEDSYAYYVVMEKCGGLDLFESIKCDAKVSPEEAKDIVFQVLSGLSCLHAKGLVHKDIKLENVMLDKTPTFDGSQSAWQDPHAVPTSPMRVKLVDFDTVEEHVPKTPKVAKDVLGTDQYIAQEAYGGVYSPASDLFAVGVIAYRLLVGRFPFDPNLFDDKPGENWVGSPKMREIRGKLCKSNVSFDLKVFHREPAAAALIKKMLAVKEFDRPTATEALSHRWFKNVSASQPSSPAHAKSMPRRSSISLDTSSLQRKHGGQVPNNAIATPAALRAQMARLSPYGSDPQPSCPTSDFSA